MRKILYSLSTLALVATLSACSGDTPPTPAAPASSSSASPEVESPEAESPSAAPVASAKTPVNQTIRDDVLDHTIKVKSVVRNFPIPARLPALQGQRELVLVEFDLKASSTYAAGLGGSDFTLVTDDGGALNSSTSSVEKEMASAGYPPLADVDSGETGTGWIAFTVSPLGSKTLTLRYKRLASRVIGSGKTIPAKTFDVPLVK